MCSSFTTGFFILSVCFLTACEKTQPSIEYDPNINPAFNFDSIQFSGYTWHVKNSNIPVGPGPNVWDSKNAWVDSLGRLHLKITSSKTTGNWACAEVYTIKEFSFGKFQFWIEEGIEKLNKNIVLGLFVYSGRDGYDEIDIEFSRFGFSLRPNLSYTVWPAFSNSKKRWTRTSYFKLNHKQSTHRFTRSATSVIFQSLFGFHDGENNLYLNKTYIDPIRISKAKMPVHINLWLYKAKPPSDKKEVEIIINSFKYFSFIG